MRQTRNGPPLVLTNGDSSPAIVGDYARISYNTINKPSKTYRLFDPYWWRRLIMAMLISSALFALVAAHLLADFRAIAGLMLFWLLAIGFAYYYSWARKAFDLYLYDKTSPIETSRGDCHEWSEIQEVRSYGRTVDLLIGTAWVKLVFAEASQQEEFLKECGKRKIHISRYDQHPGCEPLNWSTWWRPNLIFLVAIGFFSYAALGGIIPAELTKQAMFGIPILWGVFLIYTLLKLDGSIGTPAQVNKLR